MPSPVRMYGAVADEPRLRSTHITCCHPMPSLLLEMQSRCPCVLTSALWLSGNDQVEIAFYVVTV
eukprot:2704518-Rhodomonas_salina.1